MLTAPPDLDDMQRTINEMNNYLEDSEFMHNNQAKILNEIGELIQHEWEPKEIDPPKIAAPPRRIRRPSNIVAMKKVVLQPTSPRLALPGTQMDAVIESESESEESESESFNDRESPKNRKTPRRQAYKT